MQRSTTPTNFARPAGRAVLSPERRRENSTTSTGGQPMRSNSRTAFRSPSAGGTPSRRPTEPRSRGAPPVRSATPTRRATSPSVPERRSRTPTPSQLPAGQVVYLSTAPPPTPGGELYNGEDLVNGGAAYAPQPASGDNHSWSWNGEDAPHHRQAQPPVSDRSEFAPSVYAQPDSFHAATAHHFAPAQPAVLERPRAPTVTSMDTPPGSPSQQHGNESPGPADFAAETASTRQTPTPTLTQLRPVSPAPGTGGQQHHAAGEFQGVKKAVVGLKECNVALERELAATRREIADLRKALDKKLKGPSGPQPKLDRELKQALQQTAPLHRLPQEAREQTVEAQRMQVTTDTRVKELQQTVRQLSNFNASLERERNQLRQESEAVQEERRAVKREMRELREQLRQCQQSRAELEQLRDSQLAALQQLAQERKEAASRVSNAEMRYRELRDSAGSVRERREAMERERGEMEDRLRRAADELRQSKDRSKTADQRARDAKETVALLRRDLQDLEGERLRLQGLQETIAREPSGPEQIDLLEARARKLEATVRQLSQTNEGDNARFHSEVVERRARLGLGVPPTQLLQELEDQLSQLRQSNRLLVRSRDDLEAFVQQRVIQLEGGAAGAEDPQAKADLKATEQKLVEEVRALSSERAALMAEAERYRLESVQLRASNHRHHTQILAVQERIDRLQKPHSPQHRVASRAGSVQSSPNGGRASVGAGRRSQAGTPGRSRSPSPAPSLPASPPPPTASFSPLVSPYSGSPSRFSGTQEHGGRSPTPPPPPRELEREELGRSSVGSDAAVARARLNEQRAAVYRELEDEVWKAEQHLDKLEEAGQENLRLLTAELPEDVRRVPALPHDASPSASQRCSEGTLYSPARSYSGAGSPFSPEPRSSAYHMASPDQYDDRSRSPSPAPSPASSYISPTRQYSPESSPTKRREGWLPESLRCLLIELQLQEEVQRKVVVDHERIALRALMIIGANKLQRLPSFPLSGSSTRNGSPATAIGTAAGSPVSFHSISPEPRVEAQFSSHWAGGLPRERSSTPSSTASFDPIFERRLRSATPEFYLAGRQSSSTVTFSHNASRSSTPPAVVFEPVDRRYAHFEPDSPPLNSTEWLVRAAAQAQAQAQAQANSISPSPVNLLL